MHSVICVFGICGFSGESDRRHPEEYYLQIRWTSKPELLAEVIQAKPRLTTATKGKIHDHSCMEDLKGGGFTTEILENTISR